ncbi:hypothetical protein SMICM304S_01405 [Streptomyces microflavus]
MVLVPEVVEAVAPLPVLAAGGIGSGEQAAAGLALGAQGVWLGSLWLTTEEADLHSEALTRKLLAAGSGDTVRSRALTGKPARQLRTAWTDAWDDQAGPGTLPMPLQGLLVAEAVSRIQKYEVGELLGTPVEEWSPDVPNSVQAVVDDLTRGFERAVTRINRITRKERHVNQPPNGFWAQSAADTDCTVLIAPDGEERSAGRLHADVNRMVHGLRAAGMQAGDAFDVDLPNGTELLAHTAASQAGSTSNRSTTTSSAARSPG